MPERCINTALSLLVYRAGPTISLLEFVRINHPKLIAVFGLNGLRDSSATVGLSGLRSRGPSRETAG
jgi:hypothetical protein